MTPLLSIIIWVVLGCIAAVCAGARGRSSAAWFLIGTLLGWYGLLLLFILPPLLNQEVPEEPSEGQSKPSVPSVEKPKEFSPTGEWFFLDQTKTICGPVSPSFLKDKWKEGTLFSGSWVWSETTVDWKKIDQIQPFFDWLRM